MSVSSPIQPKDWVVEHRTIGDEGHPLLIIDNFNDQPDAWRKFAGIQSFAKLAPYYPGVRAAVSLDYLQIVLPPLLPLLANVFGYAKGARPVECFFSMVTTPPEELAPLQRMPHFDGGGDEKLALLHYLCPAEKGGTAFYRHRSTGFESVPDARFPTYKDAIEADVQRLGAPEKRYTNDSTELFERIEACDARYNRAVIYRGTNIHAIDIPDDFDFDPSPETGRLTINTFLQPA